MLWRGTLVGLEESLSVSQDFLQSCAITLTMQTLLHVFAWVFFLSYH